MVRNILYALCAALMLITLLFVNIAAAANIDPDNDGSKYAWGENVGWINLAPAQGPGVTVTSTAMSGYGWGENIGWINFSPLNGGVINDGAGNLSGYAWGENTGWINFTPTGGGVSISSAGIFSGSAWGENIGWISFASSGTVPFQVKTSWRPATHFTVSAPASATAGAAFNFTVTAFDQFNNTATGYAGTVHFTSSDAAAVLPANATLINGTGTFPATFYTVGSQTIMATDTVTASITGTSNVDVSNPQTPSGDINGDGQVTIGDALLALRVAVGLVPMDIKYLANGDVAPFVNGKPAPDGQITIADALIILRKSVGLINW